MTIKISSTKKLILTSQKSGKGICRAFPPRDSAARAEHVKADVSRTAVFSWWTSAFAEQQRLKDVTEGIQSANTWIKQARRADKEAFSI